MASPRSHTAFLANFKGGGARPNRFEVIITFPSSIENAQDVGRTFTFTCYSASIPEGTLGTCEVAYMGRPIKLAGDKDFPDWTVSVYLDNDFSVRKAFEAWQDQILGFSSNLALPDMVNPVNYLATAIVKQLDRADRVVEEYTIDSIFPTSIGDIPLGWDTNNTIETFQVTFAINGWSSTATTNV